MELRREVKMMSIIHYITIILPYAAGLMIKVGMLNIFVVDQNIFVVDQNKIEQMLCVRVVV